MQREINHLGFALLQKRLRHSGLASFAAASHYGDVTNRYIRKLEGAGRVGERNAIGSNPGSQLAGYFRDNLNSDAIRAGITIGFHDAANHGSVQK